MTIGAQQKLVLASQSAARRNLLAAAGIAVTIDAAFIDESAIKTAHRAAGKSADDCARALAEAKAAFVSQRHRGVLVIGADQILECGGEWLDKPVDMAAARGQLRFLRGRTHDLVTSVAVVLDGAALWDHGARTRLTMRPFSDAFLDAYVAAVGDGLLATVGGYALEGIGAQLFERVEGDYFAILGLPLICLLAFLRAQGAVAA